jgi:hypothetical protein
MLSVLFFLVAGNNCTKSQVLFLKTDSKQLFLFLVFFFTIHYFLCECHFGELEYCVNSYVKYFTFWFIMLIDVIHWLINSEQTWLIVSLPLTCQFTWQTLWTGRWRGNTVRLTSPELTSQWPICKWSPYSSHCVIYFIIKKYAGYKTLEIGT